MLANCRRSPLLSQCVRPAGSRDGGVPVGLEGIRDGLRPVFRAMERGARVASERWNAPAAVRSGPWSARLESVPEFRFDRSFGSCHNNENGGTESCDLRCVFS